MASVQMDTLSSSPAPAFDDTVEKQRCWARWPCDMLPSVAKQCLKSSALSRSSARPFFWATSNGDLEKGAKGAQLHSRKLTGAPPAADYSRHKAASSASTSGAKLARLQPLGD